MRPSAKRAARVVALACLATLGASAAVAQAPAGWTYHERIGGSMRVAIACSEQVAYARSWQGTVSRWDGASWTPLPPIPSPSYGDSIAVSADGHVFSVASNGLAHWDGSRWELLEMDRSPGDVGGVWASDAAHVYVAGPGRVLARDGARMRAYDAGTWRDLKGIWGRAGQLWTAGQGGTVMLHDGRAWTRRSPDTDEWLLGITGAGSQDVWTWSQSRVFHFDGTSWRDRSAGITDVVRAVATAADQTVAVGRFGLARLEASGWTIELAPDQLGEGYHELVGACFTARHLVVADDGGHAWTRPR